MCSVGESKRLSNLMVNANKATLALQEKTGLGERIMKLMELARVRETETEKVLPFYKSTDLGERGGEGGGMVGEPRGAGESLVLSEAGGGGSGMLGGGKTGSSSSSSIAESHTDPALLLGNDCVAIGLHPDGQPVQEWNYLNTFHKRYNQALLDQVAVQREKERLQRENKDLQTILKQFLDGISVNEDVMNSNNPLLVINGRVNLNAPLVGRVGGPAVIEGNHMVNTGRVVGEGAMGGQ